MVSDSYTSLEFIDFNDYNFANSAVAVDSSHMTVSSRASWSRFTNFSDRIVLVHIHRLWSYDLMALYKSVYYYQLWTFTHNFMSTLKQETVSGSGISWAICKSAPRSRQTTTPAPHQAGYLPAAQPTASKHWRHKFHEYKGHNLNFLQPIIWQL